MRVEHRVALISARCGATALRFTGQFLERGGDPADGALVFARAVAMLTAKLLGYPEGLLPTAEDICSSPWRPGATFTVGPYPPPG